MMLGEPSFQTWISRSYFATFIAFASLSLGLDLATGEQRFLITVPLLSMSSQNIGTTNYVVIQADRLSNPVGPEIQFNEGSRALGRFRGGALSEDWKTAAYIAAPAHDPDRLTYDRELLRKFYLSQGYADFRVVSAIAELTPAKDGFFVTFTLEEGER